MKERGRTWKQSTKTNSPNPTRTYTGPRNPTSTQEAAKKEVAEEELAEKERRRGAKS